MKGNACSFCGKTEREVERLLAGPPSVNICNECLDLCNDILGEEFEQEQRRSFVDDVPPWEPTGDELAELARIGKELGEGETWAVPVVDGKLDVSQASPVTVAGRHSDERKRRESTLTCSFCGKRRAEVCKLIAGPTVYVCDDCVDRFNAVLVQQEER